MKLSFVRTGILILGVAFTASLLAAPLSIAQGTNPNRVPDMERQREQEQQLKQRQLNEGISEKQAQVPKVDPLEEAAYKAFYDASPQDADNRIQLGEDFLQKYPSSRYIESVHEGLTNAYYSKKDWKNFYAQADKALAIDPQNVDILVMVGWVIPHIINPNDPDASEKLDKAERYEKQAIITMASLVKPANMTDEQFTATKAGKLVEAHSGLGLVYFRRQQYEDAVKELQQATQGVADPDQTDLFVLGLSLQNLQRYSEAVDAYNRCVEVPGTLEDRCKQSAEAAKQLAARSK
ncbi:MAG TPA: tetratricopeptide repeat protein [Candidatus Polarisedimenticolia bacterium]|nr:tetratricopeptide repeat protein [Candidatus Polarisedimenticolia bacterium]